MPTSSASPERHRDVEVEGLQWVPPSVLRELQAAAEEKRKTYCCVVWVAAPLSAASIAAALDARKDLQVMQVIQRMGPRPRLPLRQGFWQS